MDNDESPSRSFSASSVWMLLAVALGSSALTALLTVKLMRAEVAAEAGGPPEDTPWVDLQPARPWKSALGSPVSLICDPDIDRKGAFALGETALHVPHAPSEEPPAGFATVSIQRPQTGRAHIVVEWKAGDTVSTCILDLDASSHTASALYQGYDGQRTWVMRDVRGLVQVSSWEFGGPFLVDVTVSGHAQFEGRIDPLLGWRQFKLAIDA